MTFIHNNEIKHFYSTTYNRISPHHTFRCVAGGMSRVGEWSPNDHPAISGTQNSIFLCIYAGIRIMPYYYVVHDMLLLSLHIEETSCNTVSNG